MSAFLWLAVLTAVAGCLGRIANRSLRDFSRHELEGLCGAKQHPVRLSEILLQHETVALGMDMAASALFSISIVCTCFGLWSDRLINVTDASFSAAVWYVLLSTIGLIVPLYIVLSVLLPWTIARTFAVPFLFHTWPVCRVIAAVFYPFVWIARAFDGLLPGRKQGEHDEESLEEEIRTIVSEGHREGLLEEDAREMIESVMELGDAVVSHIMTPRTEIHMVQADTPWDELVDDIIDAGHTRVPVYDKSRDEIIGVLHIKDLLPELAKDSAARVESIRPLLRAPLFVPDSKPVDQLLAQFQQSHTHIAVVLDEYASVAGLVTIEDALEEIVGEIVDEYDKETEQDIRKIDDDSCETLGRAHVDQINELMGFDLPESEDFDTIGGFVFAEFGRVPAVGETLTWNDAVRVKVLEVTRRRVNRVRLERVRKESLEVV